MSAQQKKALYDTIAGAKDGEANAAKKFVENIKKGASDFHNNNGGFVNPNWNKVDDVVEGGKVTVPDKANDIAQIIKANNGAPPKGYKGGRTYKNIPLEEGAQKLPEGVNYKEYDINPYVKGQNRGAERIVIGDDGSVWYTNDHYYTFIKIE